jgi:hypothetical protein
MEREMTTEHYRESFANYLTPMVTAANTTRERLGLPNIDIMKISGIEHKANYFYYGYRDGRVGYYDRWYDDRIDWKAYQLGNFAGRELFKGEFQLI